MTTKEQFLSTYPPPKESYRDIMEQDLEDVIKSEVEQRLEAGQHEPIVMRGWDWQYARWLVMLRKALLATGCFEKGVYPDSKAWMDYYKYTKLTPYQVAKKDTGVAPSGFYMEWNGRHPNV